MAHRSVGQRVRARIAASTRTLTVVFPDVRPVVSGASPGAAPVRPFTGTRPTPTVAGPAGTPSRAPVVLRCLWLDVEQLAATRRPATNVTHGIWVSGATALARIDPTTLPLDSNDAPEEPEAFFASAERVDFGGKRYQLLKATPAGPSDEAPYTWYLWLGGYAKQ